MQKIRVALIEDHDLTRVGIRTALQQSGKVKVVGEAVNARGGLRLLERTQPDVAIIDMGLPDLDGIKLTRRLKQDSLAQNAPEIKVLMLTLHDDEATVLAAFAAGVNSYCLKDSINLNKLLKALQVTHKGRAWIDPLIAHIVLEQSRAQFNASQTSNTNQVRINAIPSGDKQIIKADPLTRRQLEILELIVAGYSNKQIAKQLYITVGTAKTHVRSILNKLCVDDRTKAAVQALRAGIVA